jgi:hypothetical protein
LRLPLFSILARFLNLQISRGLRGMLPSLGEDLGQGKSPPGQFAGRGAFHSLILILIRILTFES